MQSKLNGIVWLHGFQNADTSFVQALSKQSFLSTVLTAYHSNPAALTWLEKMSAMLSEAHPYQVSASDLAQIDHLNDSQKKSFIPSGYAFLPRAIEFEGR